MVQFCTVIAVDDGESDGHCEGDTDSDGGGDADMDMRVCG